MSGQFAKDTSVSVEASRMEIERILARYHAESFAYATERGKATIMFRLTGKDDVPGRFVRFSITLPDREDDAFRVYYRGSVPYRREDGPALAAWEQACRQRWRALALVIKAKLEAVAAGITTVEDEFLAHTVLPDGRSFGEWARPEIDKAYLVGKMPEMLALGAPAPK